MDSINAHKDILIDEYKEYDKINIKGNLNCNSSFKANDINVKGEINSKSDIECLGNINVKGKLNLYNVVSNTFKSHGKIKANIIKAEEIKIVSGRDSYIKQLFGNKIIVRNGTDTQENEKVMNFILNKLNIDIKYKESKDISALKIDNINGRVVELTNIEADIVIADTLILNEKCIINEVICKGSIKKDDKSIIKKKVVR